MPHEVGNEQAHRHAVEAVARLDAEGAVRHERQADERLHEHDAEEKRRAVRDRAGGEERAPRLREPLDQAAEREDKERRHAYREIDHAEARLRRGVVGRFLVSGERDRVGEARGDARAVRAHVADLPRREPQPRHACRAERDKKKPGQGVRHAAARISHGRRSQQPDLDRHGNDGPAARCRPHHRDRDAGDRPAARAGGRRPGAGGAPARRGTGGYGYVEQEHAQEERPHRPRARL